MTETKLTGIDNWVHSGVKTYNNAAQATTNGAWTIRNFNVDLWDTDSYHNVSINNDRITAPWAGYYEFTQMCNFNFHATGQRSILMRYNSGTYHYGPQVDATAAGVTGLNQTIMLYMAAGDYVNCYVYQNSGTALTITQNEGNGFFEAKYLGK